MIDYEDMILARQELDEIYEDDPESYAALTGNWWDELDPEVFE